MSTETERSPKPVVWLFHLLQYCLFHPGVELDEQGLCPRCVDEDWLREDVRFGRAQDL